MGKSKGGTSSSSGGGGKKKGSNSAKQAADAVCQCEDPYKCTCGKRPERPSKGHKWDIETKQWAGKGHKQKGASAGYAFTSTKDTVVKTTEKGGTKLAAWQSLPSTILREQCSKEKRPPPKFTLLKNDKQATSSNTIKYRCIVKDYKKSAKSENDLIFIPLNGCHNDEQAMEESALLALVQLTPKLPHERRLPEPYKTTWLHAIGEGTSSKIAAETSNATKEANANATAQGTAQQTSSATSTGTTSMATINTSLTQGVTFASRKEKEDFYQKKKASANTRKRRMEAQQQANANHSCFMSASIRHKIEWLLRGGTGAFHDDEDEDEDDDNDNNNKTDQMTEIQRYAYERLLSEGFTSKQSYRSIKENKNDEEEESYYEICLQWLCIHLNEHQLPEGFDPRGRTLDVVTTTTSSKASDGSASSTNAPMSRTVKVLTNKYGLSMEEAQYIESKCLEGMKKSSNANNQEQQPATQPDGFTVACTLWNEICHKTDSDNKEAMIQPPKKDSKQHNNDVLEEELEALKAIFFEEGSCMIDDNTKLGVLKISLSLSSMNEIEGGGGGHTVLDAITFGSNGSSNTKPLPQLCVYVSKQSYPHQSTLMAFLANVEDKGSSTTSVAATVLCEIATFVSTLPLGEPMVYELYTHVQSLLNQPLNELQTNNKHFCLMEGERTKKDSNKQTDNQDKSTNALNKSSKPPNSKGRSSTVVLRRPTDQPKSTFWTTLPNDTKPALSNPQVSSDIQRQRMKLPAQTSKQEFLSLLKTNRVVLVTGETGCGKTTQIPQFILEEDPMGSKIVVAQPRRLAATGVAGRVATERGEDNVGSKGTSVGYVVRGDVKSCASSTRLLFCTTGVLLRQLQSEHALECISHIVVDEVHERHLDTDLLLGLLKQMLSVVGDFKIILMSATMDADKLANYWSNVVKSGASSKSSSSSVPRMHIPGLTYPVEDYTLEDVLRLTGYIPPKNGKKKKKHNKQGGRSNNTRKQTPWNDSQHSDNDNDDDDDGNDDDSNNPAATSSNAIDKLTERRAMIDKHMSDMINRIAEHEIQYELLALLIQYLLDEKSSSNKKDDGSILVFLPGAPEIGIAETTIQQMLLVKSGRPYNCTLLPLHGGLQPSQQNLVFRPSSPGKTKIILSTNVAETSITIPDCTLVIDTCREKQSSFDPINRMPLLLEKFASKDSLRQRRGRAGRVRSGKCYKLISQNTLQKLPDHGTPEIQRCALDQTLLQVMFLGYERSRQGTFLQTLLDPPSTHAIESSVRALETLGAIQSKGSEQIELTPMGMHLAGIPAPPTVAKLLIMGSILGCRDAALAIAAGLTLGRSPFLKIMPPRSDNRRHNDNDDDDEKDIQKEKEDFKNVNILKERTTLFKLVGNSDHAILAAVYQKWYHMNNVQEQKRYCETLGLNQIGMKDMKLLVQQYNSALISLGFTDDDKFQKKKQTKNVSWRTVRACVVAALAPHQLVRVQRPSAKYAETSEGAVAKDVEAKQVRFFVRASDVDVDTTTNNTELGVTAPAKGYQTKRYYDILEEQVYVHPSSQCFSVGSYSCPWLVYHELVRTSKPFLRDATEASAYALLLFGGSIQVQASKGTIVVDSYIRLSASPRIGALVGGLRQHVDALLEAKVASPATIDIASSDVMTTVVQLIVSDGLGKI